MHNRGDGLSKREREVLTCLLDGMSTKKIGDTLAISPRTVQHTYSAFMRI
jgi:DNA-binding CsgD family transcriptional regulator